MLDDVVSVLSRALEPTSVAGKRRPASRQHLLSHPSRVSFTKHTWSGHLCNRLKDGDIFHAADPEIDLNRNDDMRISKPVPGIRVHTTKIPVAASLLCQIARVSNVAAFQLPTHSR